MEPEHISCYELSLESGTPLANRIGTTNFPHRNSEHDRLFFLETSRTITSRGYIHYEVSNFALNRSYRSRHNLKYWKREPYLGLGPSAHSMRGMKRWWNIRDVNGYITRVNRTESPVESSETLSEEQVVLETLLLGFRNSEGLPLSVLHADENTTRITRDLLETGLLCENNKRIIPTIEGYLVADNLPLYYGPGITSTLSPR